MLLVFLITPLQASETAGPLLTILLDTGEELDGLPRVVPHPEPEPYLRVLTRGYSGRLLRLYACTQRFVRPDRTPRPAYLVLSNQQGGFPRYGFYLDGPQPDTAYVDLHRRSTVTGRPGAMDQIFPHELLHIIVHDLAGDTPDGQATQVHAVGVRTDRVTAFNEGFAEHGQLMAIDDPDALPETRSLATDADARDRAFARMEDYRRALTAPWSIAAKARMTFPFWFSSSEQVLRYHAVRDNLFAREVDVPGRLHSRRHAYSAYLLENVLPGQRDAPPKSGARMLATEGVVSALFYRLLNDPVVQAGDGPVDLYDRFGVERGALAPLDNAYVKVFSAVAEGKYDAALVLAAYQRLFPQERSAVDAVRSRVLLGHPLTEQQPAIWLLNRDFATGTTLFDQYRAMPRPHAFDLNAASIVDLIGVPGIDAALAQAILDAAPFRDIDDLARVSGITQPIRNLLLAMRAAMDERPDPGTRQETKLTVQTLMLPYVWRALAVWLVCAAVAGGLYRLVRRVRWQRLVLIGLAAAATGLAAGWTIDSGNGLLALGGPVVILGVPAAAIRFWRGRSIVEAGMVLTAWATAAVAPALTVTPIG
jgi:hypothetical protein